MLSRECLGPTVNSLSSGLRAPQVRTGWSSTATTSSTSSTSNRAQTPSGIPGFGRVVVVIVVVHDDKAESLFLLDKRPTH